MSGLAIAPPPQRRIWGPAGAKTYHEHVLRAGHHKLQALSIEAKEPTWETEYSMDENRSKGMAKNIAGKIEGAAGDVTSDAKIQASGSLPQTEGTAQDLTGRVSEVVRDIAGDASAALAQAFEAGARYYEEANRTAERRVEDNALVALLVAGAAGYALAWLIHGRR